MLDTLRKSLVVGFVVVTASSVFAQSADLVVTKVDSPDPVVAGTNLTYTLTLRNAGPNDAQGVIFTEGIPPRTGFVSAAQTSGPAFTMSTPPVGATGTLIARIATFASGATATFTLTMRLDSDIATGTTILNVPTVNSLTPDPALANNSPTATTSVIAQADLQVTKTGDRYLVVAGNNLTYTLTLAGAGPSDAQSVSLSDVIPASTTFVSAMQTSGPAFTLSTPAVGGTGTFTATAATLAAGASASFALVVNVNAATPIGSTISNTATATSTTTDTNPPNNTDTETATVVSPLAIPTLSELMLLLLALALGGMGVLLLH